MFRKNRIGGAVKWELRCMTKRFPLMLLASAVSVIILLYGWYVFGGPCRVSLYLNIPGGMITVGMYYVLWVLIFFTYGTECVIIATQRRHICSGSLFLYHLGAHLCLFLWYPLFFTTLSQILAFGVIGAAFVLIFMELKWAKRTSDLLFCSCIIKCMISAVYLYINLAFLLIN